LRNDEGEIVHTVKYKTTPFNVKIFNAK